MNRPEPLGWERNPLPELLKLAWPIAVSMLSYSVMTLVDTLFVGHLGTAPLAAVGLGGVCVFTLICFPMGLLRAVKILVSQRVGAARRAGCEVFIGAGLAWAVLLGVGVVVAAEALLPVVAWMSDGGETAQLCVAYFRPRSWGAPLFIAAVAVREGRYGLGDTRGPMWATVFANALNVAFDYVFIVGVGWGVAGAAWASVLAQGAELAMLLVLQQRAGGFGWARLASTHLGQVAGLGWPAGMQFALEVGAFAMLAGIIGRMGSVQMAAHQVALQVIHFSFLPAFALADAASVLTGRAVGAGRDRLVSSVARWALLAASVYTGACSLILVAGSGVLADLFGGDAAMRAAAAGLLGIAAIFQVFDGAAMVGRGVLRGVGDVRFPAVVGIVCTWVVTPPAAWLLGHGLQLGARGGWMGLCAEIVISAFIYWWRVERCGWQAAAVRSRRRLSELAPMDDAGAVPQTAPAC